MLTKEIGHQTGVFLLFLRQLKGRKESFIHLNIFSMRWVKGRTKTVHLPRTASVTFTAGNLVMLTSGLVATATAQSTKHLGIILENVASTDSDFATSAVKVAVQVPLEPSCEFESTVTGTLVTTSLGVQYDLSDASTVNQGGTTYKVVTCKGFITSTKGRFSLNSSMEYSDIAWE